MEDLRLECLLDRARDVLIKLIQHAYMKNFVLVGGSALALHLCHRLSEDLDFFTYKDTFDVNKIRNIVNAFKYKEIVNISDEQIDVFLQGVRVTFFNARWKFLEPERITTLNVASLKQIAIMKTNVLFLRAKYRDYYDLYFLSNIFSLREIFDFSKDILSGINLKLFISALLFIDDIEDEDIEHLHPVEQISLKEIRHNFEEKIACEFMRS